MFSHIMIGSNDTARSKRFYNALFSAIGGKPGTAGSEGASCLHPSRRRFMVTKPIDGQPATYANGGTIGFTVENSAKARAKSRKL